MHRRVKGLKKAVTLPLVVSMLLSGCATSTQITGRSSAPQKRAVVSQDYPRTFDDLYNKVHQKEEAIGYIKRLEDIKYKTEKQSWYDPRDDIVSLVDDIESSNIAEKKSLADTVKNFSYYNETRKTTTFDTGLGGVDEDFANSSAVLIGLGAAGWYIGSNIEESEKGDSYSIEGEDILIGCGIFLAAGFAWKGLVYLIGDGFSTSSSSNERILIKPYYEKRF